MVIRTTIRKLERPNKVNLKDIWYLRYQKFLNLLKTTLSLFQQNNLLSPNSSGKIILVETTPARYLT